MKKRNTFGLRTLRIDERGLKKQIKALSTAKMDWGCREGILNLLGWIYDIVVDTKDDHIRLERV